MKLLKLLLSVLFLVLSWRSMAAESKPRTVTGKQKSTKDSSAYPYWIKMMDDTNVVYADAVKTFNLYWKSRVRPQDEEGDDSRFEGEGKENIPYSGEYKRFQDWEQHYRNMIGPDGRILTPSKQIEIWKQTLKEAHE